jgi:uncharacterized coiled-coil protein SlyX
VNGQTLTSLNQFTASQDTKNTTLASYTGSNDITNTAQNNRLTNLESKSASVDISITNINQFTASNGNTSLNQFTSSADNRLNNLESTSASVNISISNLNSTTASQGISISNLNAATSSYAISSSVAAVDAAQQSQIDSLIAASGSYLTSSTSIPLTSLNSFTASQYVSNSFFATTGSNTFNGTQTINGNLLVNDTGATTIFDVSEFQITGPNGRLKLDGVGGATLRLNGTATSGMNDFDITTNTISGTGSVIFQNANNGFIFARFEPTDKTTIYNKLDVSGSVSITGSLTASIQQGYAWVGNANGVSVAVATSSFVGTSTDITALNAFTASQDTKNSTLATYTGSNDTKWSNLGSQTGSFVTETESGSFLITASVNLNTITFTKGDNTTFAVTVNTGSATSTDITSLNSFTASQDTKNSTIATYTASVDTKFSNIGSQSASWDNTNLNSFTASQDTKNSTIATYTGSNDTKWSNLGSQSGSFVTESETGSFARTNVDNNFSVNQTFTNITAVSASFQYLQTTYETASIIYSSGSNQFGDELTDIQTLSGSVKVQGSLTINGTPVQTSSVDITSLNSFTASQDTKNSTLATYTASVNSSLTNINTFTASNGNTSLNSYTASNDTKWSNLAGQTGSYVTSAITASSLVTASVNLNTITFTKGDASTFNITVDTGSAVTTDLTSLNAFTASQDTKNSTLASVTSSLNSATASLFTSTSLALTTASFAGNTLTFTKGNGTTFGVVIPDVSGSTINTGSLLLTASAFTNTITFTKGDGTTFPVTVTTGSLNYVTGSFGAFYDTTTQSGSAGVAYSMKLNNTDISDGVIISGSGGIKVLAAGTYDLQFSAQVLADTGADTVWIWLKKNGTNVADTSTKLVLRNNEADVAAWNFLVSANANDVFELAWQSNGGHTKLFAEAAASNYTAIPSVIATMNRVDVGGGTNLVSTASFNAYTSSNDQKVNSLINATASYVTSAITASSLVTASVSLNTITFTKGDASTFSLTVDTGSGGGALPSGLLSSSVTNFVDYSASVDTRINGIVAGTGFATTGSNTFTGDQTFIDNADNFFTISDASGSMMLVAKGFTSASAHMSSSAAGIGNFIFKTNSNTADTIISGSGNMFINPAAPTAGFKRYIGGSGNIALNGSNVPQISGSMQFSPTMNNNYFGSNGATITMRGPVSASTYTISANNVLGTINIGSSAALNAQKLTGGLSMQQNIVAGTLTIVANQSALTGSTTTVSSNTINGVVVLNLSSSAVSFQQSNINDGNFIFTNQFSSGALGIGLVSTSNNTIGGFSNTLIVTGSVLTGSLQPSMFNNLVIGSTNTGFINTSDSRISGSNVYQNLLATSLLGNRLIVTGSSLGTDLNSFGSLFVGRWNANDGIKNKTSDVIFAVGTGISGSGTTGRKTGFLIDSGSNTFVEGTLNVSGSSNFNGNVSVTGSLLVNGTSVSTVGFATTGSNSFIGNQRITGSLTISGSIITVDRSGETGNVYMGQNALGMGTAGAQPLALGNTIAVAIGNGAMRFASGSNQNIAIGNNALLITSGSKNFAMGSEALSSNTTGTSNIGIGTSALQNNTGGERSTAIGDSAAQFASGSQNTFIGHSSGMNVTGSNNVIIGSYKGVAGEVISNNIILSDGQQNVRAQYSGSAWSFQDGIKLNKGSNKTTDIVTLTTDTTGSATLSNSLINSSSIILLTQQAPSNRICYNTTFTAGASGGIATWYECGGYISSSLELGANQVMTICGEQVSFTGAGSVITSGSRCGAGGVWIKGEPTSNSVVIGSNVFSSSMMVQYLIVNPT